MTFVHDSPEWGDLLLIVASAMNLDPGMVEKDYWVTHALWAIQHQGFAFWFKGGTSLSKGFELIERFSEDIDARMDAGTTGLTDPRLSWNNEKGGVEERDAWFDAVASNLAIPACHVTRDLAGSDDRVRSAWFSIQYPTLHAHTLPSAMRRFVLLEVGRARVVPFVERDVSSWIHDYLEQSGRLAAFTDNRPRRVRCIHPWVTCLEKVEAVARKFEQGREAPDFVRHYEDAARIIASWTALAPPELDLAALTAALETDDHKQMPAASHAAFTVVSESQRWREIQDAWQTIGPMYWGPRMDLDVACATIRAFLERLPRD